MQRTSPAGVAVSATGAVPHIVLAALADELRNLDFSHAALPMQNNALRAEQARMPLATKNVHVPLDPPIAVFAVHHPFSLY